jgi:hypothetical protein
VIQLSLLSICIIILSELLQLPSVGGYQQVVIVVQQVHRRKQLVAT